jgi:hypothetical protein
MKRCMLTATLTRRSWNLVDHVTHASDSRASCELPQLERATAPVLTLLSSAVFANNMANEETQPTPDEKARYLSAKKDLVAAIAKKRNLDKQLVRPRALRCSRSASDSGTGPAGGQHL